MKLSSKHILAVVMSLAITLMMNNTAWSNESSDDLFILATTSHSMNEVVSTIKSYAKKKKWVYLGDFKIKKGKVILVKFCVKSAGKIVFKAGLKVSAMLPCGNVGVYQKNGETEISLLNPGYMNTLYPDPNLEEAAELLMPIYEEMMDAIVK